MICRNSIIMCAPNSNCKSKQINQRTKKTLNKMINIVTYSLKSPEQGLGINLGKNLNYP